MEEKMGNLGTYAMRGTVVLGTGLAAIALLAVPAGAATLTGKPTTVGKGTAQVIVETDSGGAPTSIAISMTEGAITGVPTELNKNSPEGGYEYALAMPEGVKSGYSEVMIDWNPKGHPPEHVYTVPHFDFHFYAIAPEEIEGINFTGPDDPAVQVSDKELLPPDYQVIPDTAVPMMGVHALDMTAPELHGKPFTETFIYGYDKGKLIFLEPMVTQAFLETKPDATIPVKTPAKYSEPGYYPTSYTVRFDATADRYLIQLGGLKAWK
jgi:hypothetical protein